MSKNSLALPIPEVRKEQMKAALTRLALELCALDIKFAVVMYDLQAQDEGTTRLSFAGNVSAKGATALFEQYLESQTSPDARVTTTHNESASFDQATIN